MRKPPPALVLAMATPLLTGCFGTLPAPLPEPGARAQADVRGVILRGDTAEGERVEFADILDVQWHDESLAIVGVPRGAVGTQPVTRTFPFTDLSGVLVRQLDTNRTSALIAGTMLGLIGTVAFLVTGKTKEGGPIGGR